MSISVTFEVDVFTCRAKGHVFAFYTNAESTVCPICTRDWAEKLRVEVEQEANELTEKNGALRATNARLRGVITSMKRQRERGT